MKKTVCLAAALLLLVLMIPAFAAGGRVPSNITRKNNQKKKTAAPQIVITTPGLVPVPSVTPSPTAGTDTEQPGASSDPTGGRLHFSFGYADVPAGLQAYQNTEGSAVFGVFAESGAAYASSVSDDWVKLVFISADTQAVTEVFVPTQDVTETHASAADALRSRLSKYQPVYYQGYPLPTIRFEFLSDANGEETAASPEAENGDWTAGPVPDVDEEAMETEPSAGETVEETVLPEEDMEAAADEPENRADTEVPWQTAVTDVSAVQTGACQALISWQGNGTAEQYSVYLSEADGTQTFLGYAEGTDSYTTPELEDGKYTFIVRPRRIADGIVSTGDASQPVSVTIKVISWKTAPTHVRAEAVGRDVTISWESNGLADQHSVYMASGDSVLRFAGKTENGESELTLHDLPDGKYLFLVRARRLIDDIVWHGDASASVSVAVPAVLWSTAVTGLRASVSDDERAAVVLTWKGNGKAAQYDVFEWTDEGEHLVGRASHAVTCILPDVSGEEHRYLVRPSREIDGQTELGEASETVTADLSDVWRTAPRDATATINGRKITLTWTGNRLTDSWAVFEQTQEGWLPVLWTNSQEAVITDADEGGHVYLIYPARGEEEPELGEPSDELFTVTGSHRAFGRTGGELVWTMDDDGTLILYGNGPMEDFDPDHPAPWAEYRDSISAVLLDPDLTSIGSSAFEGCAWLSYAILPESLQVIGDSAFRDCASLTSVSFPETLNEIRSGAFADSGLLYADLPEGLNSLGDAAFSGCSDLISVTLPDTVSYIGEYAFSDCPSLTRVVSY